MARRDDDDSSWAMPFGEPAYTHAPEAPSMTMGTAYQRPEKTSTGWPRRRRIGFRPPGVKKWRRDA